MRQCLFSKVKPLLDRCFSKISLLSKTVKKGGRATITVMCLVTTKLHTHGLKQVNQWLSLQPACKKKKKTHKVRTYWYAYKHSNKHLEGKAWLGEAGGRPVLIRLFWEIHRLVFSFTQGIWHKKRHSSTVGSLSQWIEWLKNRSMDGWNVHNEAVCY